MALITSEMARGMAGQVRQRAAVDPEFAEDCESIYESMQFLIRYGRETRCIICECCGTLVVDALECSVYGRDWKRAIWEHETGRKHTLRRCNWKRDQALISKSSMK